MSLNLESNKEQINIKEAKPLASVIYEFEGFCLDAEYLMLSRGDEEISLTPKVVETLLALVERHGEIVSKDELMDRVWENAFVEESNLVQNIYVLRKVLGKTIEGQPMIETLRRRGYRFNGKVTKIVKERSVTPAIETAWRDHQDLTEDPAELTRAKSRRFKFLIAAVIVVCVLTIAAGLNWSRLFNNRSNAYAATGQPANITFKRLTPDLYTRSPAVSPDGKYLAYSQIDHDKESFWLKDIASDAAVQLLPPVDLDEGYNVMHFSPDGAQLYYSTHLPHTLNHTIFRYTLATRDQTRIAEDDISPSAVSPDGKQVVFINSKYEMVEVNSDGSGGAHVLRQPKEGEWLVAWNSEMSWSADGTRIALCGGHSERGRSIGDLLEFDVGSGQERRITVPGNWEQIDDAVWLSDGKDLLVTARQAPAEPFQMYRVSSENGTAIRLTNDDHDYRWISISSDTGIVAVEQGTGHFNIWTAPLSDPRNLSRLTFGNVAADGYDGIAFMPDGRIVYSATRSGSVDLWMMNADGSGQTQLTANAGNWNARPRVTRDGRFIVFSSTRTGISQLWRMDADGGNPKQLTDSTDPAFRASISPDGNSIYYNTENDGALWKISIEGSEPIPVSQQRCLFPSISPDDKLIACVEIENGQPNSWRMQIISAASGELVQRYDYPVGRSLLVWAADSRSVISTNGNWSNLFDHPLEGISTRQLTDFTADRIPYFAVSPDYKRIAMSRGTSFSETVELTGLIDSIKRN
jgi:Tol biopolymer transport system component/DNA-binding winged helix-turn-helix (wHTH) protein